MAENSLQNQKKEVSRTLDYKSGNDSIKTKIEALDWNYTCDSAIKFLKGYDSIEEKKRKDGIDSLEKIKKTLLDGMGLSSFEELYKEYSLIVDLTTEDNVFYVNGAFVNVEDFSLQEFITNHISDTTTLFLKTPDFDINKDSLLPFRKWVIENRFLHGVIQLPATDDTGQLLIIKKQSIDKVYFVDARGGYVKDKKVDIGKVISTIEEKDSEHYIELSIDAFLCIWKFSIFFNLKQL